MGDNDLAEQLARRDRFLRHRSMQMTPEERMRAMARLQEIAFTTLRRSPQGYAHFMRRNFKARAIKVQEIGVK